MRMDLNKEIKNFILQNYLFSSDESLVKDNESLMQKGIIDSTGILELIMHLEERYSIEVLDNEMVPANLDSVENVVAFVRRKQGVAA